MKKVMKSLNENILDEFRINELEKRLETDPMLLGNPLDASMLSNSFDCTLTLCFSCTEF